MTDVAEAQLDRLTQELSRLHIENARHKVFIRAIQDGLPLNSDTVWFTVHTTLNDAIDCHLDNPILRGETPLFGE